MLLADFINEAWAGIMIASKEIPVGPAKAWSEVVEEERRKAFAKLCLQIPAARPKDQ